MTRKKLDERVDTFINLLCRAHALDKDICAKGGQREDAYAMFASMLGKNYDLLIDATFDRDDKTDWRARCGLRPKEPEDVAETA